MVPDRMRLGESSDGGRELPEWLDCRLRPRRAVVADAEASPSEVAGSSTRCDRFPVQREDIDVERRGA